MPPPDGIMAKGIVASSQSNLPVARKLECSFEIFWYQVLKNVCFSTSNEKPLLRGANCLSSSWRIAPSAGALSRMASAMSWKASFGVIMALAIFVGDKLEVLRRILYRGRMPE